MPSATNPHILWARLGLIALVTTAPAVSSLAAARGTRNVPTATAPRLTTSERVLNVLDHIHGTMRSSTYQHVSHIDERRGIYDFDCSAMAAWVLMRAAPRALATVGGNRPLAVDFFRTIVRAPTAQPRSGWQHIGRIADARPGDVLAWQRPPWFPSHNTGHVAFVVGVPEPFRDGYLIRIADASSFNHQDDTRAGGTGFGLGTILIATDSQTGEGTAYGWFGRFTPAEYMIPTPIVIGRTVQ